MKEILRDYFKTDKLEILDGGKPASLTRGDKFYNGVTFGYICQWVLANKYPEEQVAKALVELFEEGVVIPAPCHNVDNLVFFKPNEFGWCTFDIEGGKISESYWFRLNEGVTAGVKYFNKCLTKLQS